MNRSGAVPVVIALLSISALGVAATTLETTLKTDPDDEINPDWDRLPIGQNDAAVMQEEIEGTNDDSEGEESDTEAEEGGSDGDRDDSTGGVFGESERSDEGEDGTGSGLGMDTVSGEASLFDRLLALLAALLRVLVPLLVLAALGALVYRYREALLSVFGLESEAKPASETVSVDDDWPGTEPSNVVDRAWLTLVRVADPDRPETTTADECRALARDRGLDETAVEAIATAFERVHYGDIPATEEAQRARRGLRRLELEGGRE